MSTDQSEQKFFNLRDIIVELLIPSRSMKTFYTEQHMKTILNYSHMDT